MYQRDLTKLAQAYFIESHIIMIFNNAFITWHNGEGKILFTMGLRKRNELLQVLERGINTIQSTVISMS